MNIDLATSIFAYILGFQTILLIILILRQKRQSTAQMLLVLMLSFYVLSLLNLANAYLLQTTTYLEWIAFLQLELLFGFGPSLFLYTKSLTDQSYRFKIVELFHFLPAALEFTYYRTSYFRDGALSLAESANSISNYVYQWVQWGGLLSVFIYLSLSIYLLIKYRKWVKNTYSDLEKRALDWHEKPVMAYSIFWLIWITLRVFDILIYDDSLRPYYFNLGFIGVAIITLWIGFKGYMSTQIEVSGFLSAPQKPFTPARSSVQLSLIAQTLEQLMAEEKFYLDSDLTLAKLSAQMAYSERDISKALNNCLHLTFHQFVNQYRVEAFKENLLREELAHLNLLGIALESGFGSKSSFNLVFKANTGLTPKQYAKKVALKKS